MTTTLQVPNYLGSQLTDDSIERHINGEVDAFMESLPDPGSLTGEERRALIARYSSVLEGNFIYWMTASLIAVKSEESREELLENLHEEVRDAHPDMLRRFAIAAHAFPTEKDSMDVHEDLTKVRLFLGKLSAVPSLTTMAFFEGFIQRFMNYLAGLAAAQGSSEMEYTDVHGVCDIEHTAGLFRALRTEMTINPPAQGEDIYEGVHLLRKLMERVIFNGKLPQSA
jgi:hypothetical protein